MATPKFQPLQRVYTKARTYHGLQYPAKETEYEVEVSICNSITIFRNGEIGATFQLGDTAVYGSYNLIYTGTIISIGAKSVTVRHYEGGDKVSQMDFNEFSRRNFDYDAEEVANHNFTEMQCL
jgi:hypothetical protein